MRINPEKLNYSNSRLVDAAVVEDKVDAGELLAGLLGLQIELHHSLVTYNNQTRNYIPKS